MVAGREQFVIGEICRVPMADAYAPGVIDDRRPSSTKVLVVPPDVHVE